MNLEYLGHQKLAELEAAVEAQMSAGRIRMPWTRKGGAYTDDSLFETKAFVLQQLGQAHAAMCENDIHAPGPELNGRPSSECPYCGYVGSTY